MSALFGRRTGFSGRPQLGPLLLRKVSVARRDSGLKISKEKDTKTHETNMTIDTTTKTTVTLRTSTNPASQSSTVSVASRPLLPAPLLLLA